jgi:hypothetical protein
LPEQRLLLAGFWAKPTSATQFAVPDLAGLLSNTIEAAISAASTDRLYQAATT